MTDEGGSTRANGEIPLNMPPGGSKTGLEPIEKRVPIERKIDLRFDNFEGLVTGVSTNLSASGMFIQSSNPEPADTEFVFALRIEEWSPIQGTAKVAWTRLQSEGPERPAGMGVKFLDLDAQSRRMIRWLVDKHMQEGGKPFDLDTVPAGASKYGGRGKGKKSGKGPAGKPARRTRSRTGSNLSPRSRGLLGLLMIAILAAGAYGVYWKWIQDQPGVGSLRSPRAADTGGATRSPGSGGPDSGADPDPNDTPSTPTVMTDQVAGFIQSWAKAWEQRDPEAVVAHYLDTFDAAAYGGRQQWESDLQQRLESSEYVRMAVSALDISFPTAETARAAFFRSFRSNVRDDSGRLLLEIDATDDGWKIRSEQPLD